ncbi:hypothetical protein [Alistipes shahii]|jgi:hypothetical protein|uniref:hypothetical protein n=1 Tax=Alistipes shahii TaxID=328814 RepID=UPI00205E5F88|nr:MAG TPA: hypothetical protein [Caudoviricetes sp.]
MDKTAFKSIRARLYADIACHLMTSGLVKYVDLYNNQFAHLEEEKIMQFPCALVEFREIAWRQLGRHAQRGDLLLDIHVATKAAGKTSAVGRTLTPAIEYFELLDALHVAMRDLRLDYAGTFSRVGSATDHDHDSLLVNVETYRVGITDLAAVPETRLTSVGIEIGEVTANTGKPITVNFGHPAVLP